MSVRSLLDDVARVLEEEVLITKQSIGSSLIPPNPNHISKQYITPTGPPGLNDLLKVNSIVPAAFYPEILPGRFA